MVDAKKHRLGCFRWLYGMDGFAGLTNGVVWMRFDRRLLPGMVS
jgi:hypothetical protein